MSFLETLRRLDKEATAAPWIVNARDNVAYVPGKFVLGLNCVPMIGADEIDANLSVIVSIRNSLPLLAAVVEAATKRRASGHDENCDSVQYGEEGKCGCGFDALDAAIEALEAK